jgi:hypothetical protein
MTAKKPVPAKAAPVAKSPAAPPAPVSAPAPVAPSVQPNWTAHLLAVCVAGIREKQLNGERLTPEESGLLDAIKG